jgi:hypothetical protein
VSGFHPEPSPSTAADLAGLRTSLFAELRAARFRRVAPKWLELPAEWSRTLARASSVAVFLVTGIGFAYYPRPWCSHWSPQKTLSVEIVSTGAGFAMLSLCCCLLAAYLSTSSSTFKERPLRLAVCLNIAAVLMRLFTPAW